MLDVNILEKRFPSSQGPVIAGLQLKLERGEFVALIGPSGVGKSTLLQMISGLDDHYQGSITAHGSEGRDPRISYMFQDPRLMPWLTAIENVQLVTGGDKDAPWQSLEAVGLAREARHYPNQLSGGMQRRVALARAFAHRPDLLLMDEPFVSLDQPNAEKMHRLLLDLWRERQPAVLFVSHNLEEAITLADRLVFLSAGPAQVILDIPVTLSRPRCADRASRDSFKRELLAAHPQLLTGRASG